MNPTQPNDGRAAKSLDRTIRRLTRRALPASIVLVVLMMAGSSMAMGATLAPSVAPASLHLAAPIASLHAHGTVAAPVTHATPKAPAHLPHATPKAPSAHPAANNSSFVESGRATFFSNTPIPNPTAPNNTCRPYFGSYYYCWNQTVGPSLNLTTDGYTGLAYTAFANTTECGSQGPFADTVVGFVVSTDFGFTWNTPEYLSNPVCTGYPDQNYSSATDPSLTSLSNGTFALSYIQYNSSTAYVYYQTPPGGLACKYSTASRVIVRYSYDHGASWSIPTVIDGKTFNSSINSCPYQNFPDLRPQITGFGQSLYLTWSAATNPINYLYGYNWSSQVLFTNSSDGGVSWSQQKQITAIPSSINGYSSDYATAPTVLTDPSGRLYLSYSTDYGTTFYCGSSFCNNYDTASVIMATSTNNGTSFTFTHVADGVFAGYPANYPELQWEPFSSLAYNPVFHQVYIAYSTSIVGNFCDNNYYGIYCGQNQVDKVAFQNSSTNGSTWSPVTYASTFNQTQDWLTPAYNPSMAVDVNGRLHLQYAEINDGICINNTLSGYGYCGANQDMYVNSTDNGTSWSAPLVVAGDYSFTYGPYRYYMWDGYTSSTLTAGTQVLLGWTQMQCPNIFTTGCYTPYFATAPTLPPIGSEVITSRLYEAPGITLTFNETGLPANAIWSVDIQGNLRDGPAGVNLSISGVPPSSSVKYYSPWFNASYGTAYYPTPSIVPPASFTVNTTIKEVYSKLVLVNLLTVPAGFQSYVWPNSYYYLNVQLSPVPGAYWVTASTPLTFTVSYYSPIYNYCFACMNLTFQSWTGTGPGSVTTNASSITFSPTGPVNETANFQVNGVCWGTYYNTTYRTPSCLNYTYVLDFQEQGLPGGTNWGVSLFDPTTAMTTRTSNSSLIRFVIGSGLEGFQAWTIPAGGGMYWVPSASQTSPLSLPQAGSVLITYTLESLGSSTFSTIFKESGLPNQTAWAVSVAGTSYGETTTNSSLSLVGGNSYDVNGSTVYLSNGTGYYVSSITVLPLTMNQSSYSITPNTAFTVNGSSVVTLHYSVMYRVTVTGSVGGTVSPASMWVHLGQGIAIGETAATGYHFVGWSGTGTGSVTSATTNPTVTPRSVVTEFATFRPNAPPTWNITLSAAGLPAGTAFSISIGGTTYSGLGAFKVGNVSEGEYPVSVPMVFLNSSETTRFVPTGLTSSLELSSGMLNISANGTVSVVYTAQFALSIASTPGGTVSWGTSGSTGISWFNQSQQVTFNAVPDPHYYFVSWNGTGNGSVTSTTASITMIALGPATETAQFQWRPNQPPATFWLQVTETGLPTGTSWSVAVGGLGASGINTTLTVMGLNGSYGLTASTIYPSTPGIRWVSNASNLTQHITANGTFSVAYSEQVEVTVMGAVGGTVTPIGTQWVALGTVVNLAAVANATSDFLSWNGTGSGNYTGTSASTSVTVTGPITEQVVFGPKAQVSTSQSSSGNGELMSLGLLVALLVAGLVIGLLVGRRRASPPMSEAPPAEDAPMEPSGDMPPPPMAEYDEGPTQS